MIGIAMNYKRPLLVRLAARHADKISWLRSELSPLLFTLAVLCATIIAALTTIGNLPSGPAAGFASSQAHLTSSCTLQTADVASPDPCTQASRAGLDRLCVYADAGEYR